MDYTGINRSFYGHLFQSNYNMTRIKTKYLKEEIDKILDEDGISPEELALRTGVSKSTIYAILSLERPTVRKSTAREIAKGTGREAIFEGDKVKFKPINNKLLSNFRRNLNHILSQNPGLLEDIKRIDPEFASLIKLVRTGEVRPSYKKLKEIAVAIGYPLELLVQPAPLILPGGKDEERPFVQNYFTAMNHPEDTLRLLLDPYEYQIIQLLRQLPKSDKAKIMDVLKILFEDKVGDKQGVKNGGKNQ